MACASDGPDPNDDPGPGDSTINLEVSSEIVSLMVGPDIVECEGEGTQTCLLVRAEGDPDWELFYDEIVGFDHSPGATSTLLVEVIERRDPQADAGSLTYEVLEVVEVSTE